MDHAVAQHRTAIRLTEPLPIYAPAWRMWRSQPAAQRLVALAPANEIDLERRILRGSAAFSDRSAVEYRRMIAVGHVIVGTVALTRVSWADGLGEIECHVDERWHRQGIGSGAVSRFVAMVFSGAPLRRVVAVASVANAPAARLLRRVGFTLEGTLRAHHLIRGQPTDHHSFGLLRSEWHPAKDA